MLHPRPRRCRRPGNRQDVLCAINLVNHLDQIDYTGLPVSDQSVPAKHRPVVMAAELAKWTRKIGGIETFSKTGCALDPRDRPGRGRLGGGISPAAGAGRLWRDPLAACVSTGTWSRSSWSTSSSACRRPSTRMPAGGTTAPVTAPAILALGAAETLAAVVLAYAVRDDARGGHGRHAFLRRHAHGDLQVQRQRSLQPA